LDQTTNLFRGEEDDKPFISCGSLEALEKIPVNSFQQGSFDSNIFKPLFSDMIYGFSLVRTSDLLMIEPWRYH